MWPPNNIPERTPHREQSPPANKTWSKAPFPFPLLPPAPRPVHSSRQQQKSDLPPPPASLTKNTIREAIITGTVDTALTRVSEVLDQLKEFVQALIRILEVAKQNLSPVEDETCGLTIPALQTSSAKLIWSLLKVPEFQEIMGTFLARALAEQPGPGAYNDQDNNSSQAVESG